MRLSSILAGAVTALALAAPAVAQSGPQAARSAVGQEKCQTACKPGFVPFLRTATIIPLDRPLLIGSRDLPGHLRR